MTAEPAAPPAEPARPPARRQVDLARPVTDLDAAYRAAQAFATSALIPKALRGKPEDVLLVIGWGAEFGLGPLQALANISVVSGRPILGAGLMAGLARQAGHRLSSRVDESQATVTLTRGDTRERTTVTFTTDDALRAGLLRVDPKTGELVAVVRREGADPGEAAWTRWAPDMLYARALSRAVRRGAPEVLLGLVAEPPVEGWVVEAEVEPFDGEPAGPGEVEPADEPSGEAEPALRGEARPGSAATADDAPDDGGLFDPGSPADDPPPDAGEPSFDPGDPRRHTR